MRALTGWLIALGCGCAAAQAQGQTIELGPFGEVTTWLVAYVPGMPLDKDPLGALGGEARFAAMDNPKLLPFGGRSLELPGQKADEKIQVPWQIARMVPPEYPNIWAKYPRLQILLGNDGKGIGGMAYCYCRLISPRAMSASLITGIDHMGAGRYYLNGKDLGYTASTRFWEGEDLVELPLELRQGANHLLVRLQGVCSLSCRLVGPNAEPLRSVTEQLDAAPDAPLAPGRLAPSDDTLLKLAKDIPPPLPAAHPEGFGAQIARTMALLESGKYTHRPVRILFYGQSIESGWPDLLVQRLRERYPDTPIVYDNRALGGWFVWRLMKSFKHDIPRWQPDLVLFHAYQGTAETWERFLSDLRRETTADIIVRTAHLSGSDPLDAPPENSETILLRRLAREYNVELIELRSEWLAYLKANNLQVKEFLADGVHLNRKGQTLMALLYERHFQDNLLSRQGWADTVRRYDVMRFLEERQTDEIVLTGRGWTAERGYALSASPKDTLKLKFVGTRVNLVLPPGRGAAAIRIDGRKPSEWKLFHSTLPMFARTRDHYNYVPEMLMTVTMGKDMIEETWTLTFTHATTDKLHSRFRVVGSRTGVDGEGDTDHDFVSRSGRITIPMDAWFKADERRAERRRLEATPAAPLPVPEPLEKQAQLVWHIVPDSRDLVRAEPNLPPSNDYYSGMPYSYITIFDGLPCGAHELTLTPLAGDPKTPFAILGIDVYRPPLATDTARRTEAP